MFFTFSIIKLSHALDNIGILNKTSNTLDVYFCLLFTKKGGYYDYLRKTIYNTGRERTQ